MLHNQCQTLVLALAPKRKTSILSLKTRGVPMGRPKLEVLASNSAHMCHAI